MFFSKIPIDGIVSQYPLSLFEKYPFYFHPDFLKTSQYYASYNHPLLNQSNRTLKEVSAYYIQIKTLEEQEGIIPCLRIQFENDHHDLIPTKNIKNAILFKNNAFIFDEYDLFFKLSDAGYHISMQKNLTGWNLKTSLFSIFNFFPEDEQHTMAIFSNKIEFKPLHSTYEQKLFERFYSRHLEKNINFPALMKRPQTEFLKILGGRYSVWLVYLGLECVGFISFVKHLNKIHTLDLIGNATYKKAMPTILFHFLKWAHENKIDQVDTIQFDWCLIPFVKELISQLSPDVIAPFYKKALQMQQRMLKEV